MNQEISWRDGFVVLLPYYASSNKKISCRAKLILGAVDSTQGEITDEMMSEALGLNVQGIQQDLKVLSERRYINIDMPTGGPRKISINISKIVEDN